MKWNNYPLSFRIYESVLRDMIVRSIRKTGQYPKGPKELVDLIIDLMQGMGENSLSLNNTNVLMRAEAYWLSEKRPYYNVWPSVIKPFTSVDLSKIKVSDLSLPLDRLVIRFPVGCELHGAKSIFVLQAKSENVDDCGFLIAIDSGLVDKFGVILPTVNAITVHKDATITERLKFGRDQPYSEDKINDEMVDNCWKLVIAVSMLADNPDLIEQVPLEADRVKWEKTHDIKLIEKAEQGGKREWDIGKHIQVAPGFRNAHFAIRWMGKGGHKATLRPVKSCLVKRRVIEDVPTGWLDEYEPNSGE